MDEKNVNRILGFGVLALVAKAQIIPIISVSTEKIYQGTVVISKLEKESIADKLPDFAGNYAVVLRSTTSGSVIGLPIVPTL